MHRDGPIELWTGAVRINAINTNSFTYPLTSKCVDGATYLSLLPRHPSSFNLMEDAMHGRPNTTSLNTALPR